MSPLNRAASRRRVWLVTLLSVVVAARLGDGEAGDRAAWSGPVVDVTWEADGALLIRSDATAVAFDAVAMVDGVIIRVNLQP